jgi:glycosyltransferase involved in cell wall biosynthesis
MERGLSQCTALTFVRNGGEQFRDCLESAKFCKEHVILDGNSTDQTKSLAQEYECKVISQSEECLSADGRILDYSCITNQGIENSSCDWVMIVSADEDLSEELQSAISDIVNKNIPGAYMFRREYLLGDKLIKHASSYPNLQIRFFHKSCIDCFIKPIHERPKLKDGIEAQILPGVQYIPLDDTKSLKQKHNRYIALEVYHRTGLTWRTWFRVTFEKLFRVCGRIARIIVFRLRYPWHTCLPLRYEWLNIRYSLLLILRLFPLYPRPRV